MSNWGKASKNNTIGFGQGSVNNNINWGKSQKDSSVAGNWAGETNISGDSATPPPSDDSFPLKLKFDVVSGVEKTISIGRIDKPDSNPVTIDWGDGQTEQLTFTGNSTISHTYNSGNTGATQNPIVSFGEEDDLGRLSSFQYNMSGDDYDLLSIDQWGKNVYNYFTFRQCKNLQLNAIDKPDLSNTTSLGSLFDDCTAFTGNESMKDWDTSYVTSLNSTFRNCINFNVSALNWDTSNVNSFQAMFYCGRTGIFNGRLNNWNFSSSISITNFLTGQINFNNTSINTWNVSGVTIFNSCFKRCTSLNQDLNNWDMSSAIQLTDLFYECYAMNGDISNWDTRNVTTLYGTFRESGFDITNAGFNTNANNIYWNTSNVTDMSFTFYKMQQQVPSISNWDTSSVTNFTRFAEESTNFNPDIENWDTSAVVVATRMFYNALQFDKDLSSWDLSNAEKVDNMFYTTDISFDLSSWDFSNGEELNNMLQYSSSWNHNISGMTLGPNISSVSYIFYDTGISSINLTDTIVGWAVQVYVASAPHNVDALNLVDGGSEVEILTTRTDDNASGLSYAEKYATNWTNTGWRNSGDALEYLTTPTAEGGAGWSI